MQTHNEHEITDDDIRALHYECGEHGDRTGALICLRAIDELPVEWGPRYQLTPEEHREVAGHSRASARRKCERWISDARAEAARG